MSERKMRQWRIHRTRDPAGDAAIDGLTIGVVLVVIAPCAAGRLDGSTISRRLALILLAIPFLMLLEYDQLVLLLRLAFAHVTDFLDLTAAFAPDWPHFDFVLRAEHDPLLH
jgi:hypothetical protein